MRVHSRTPLTKPGVVRSRALDGVPEIISDRRGCRRCESSCAYLELAVRTQLPLKVRLGFRRLARDCRHVPRLRTIRNWKRPWTRFATHVRSDCPTRLCDTNTPRKRILDTSCSREKFDFSNNDRSLSPARFVHTRRRSRVLPVSSAKLGRARPRSASQPERSFCVGGRRVSASRFVQTAAQHLSASPRLSEVIRI